MKAIIVDDEMLARKRISHLLKEVPEIEVARECSNGKTAISEINRLKPDLLFLDINMKDRTGFEVLEHLDFHPKPLIVFVTAYDEHALKAFDFEAFDFLLKPFTEERFYKTIKKVLDFSTGMGEKQLEKRLEELYNASLRPAEDKGYTEKLPIRQGNKTLLLKSSKIRYIIASGYYAEIFTKDKKYVIRESLGNLTEMLDPEKFFRVHRSTIINLDYIGEIIHSNYSEIDVRMKDNKLIRVSKSQKKKFLSKIGF